MSIIYIQLLIKTFRDDSFNLNVFYVNNLPVSIPTKVKYVQLRILGTDLGENLDGVMKNEHFSGNMLKSY